MLEKTTPRNPNLILAVLNNKCPHCRTGYIFQDKGSYNLTSFMKMNERCPVCGQLTEIEQGFYYGTGYVSYALTVAYSAITFIAWWIIIGMSVDDNRVFWWLSLNSVMLLISQPYLMRLSRTIWLSVFVSFDIHWQSKRDFIGV